MLGLPDGVRACLFDLDGVLTDTASVHKDEAMFDDFLRRRGGESHVRPFDDDDYRAYADGTRVTTEYAAFSQVAASNCPTVIRKTVPRCRLSTAWRTARMRCSRSI